MGFIKGDNQPSYAHGPVHINSNEPQPGQFAFLPYSNSGFDNIHPSELGKPGTSDGRSKVARACTECKSRKMRCDGGLPFCGRCITHSRTKSCAYVDPPKRSPITRQYVSSLEAQLEDAKRKIVQLETTEPKPLINTTHNKSISDKPAALNSLSPRHAQPLMHNRSLTGEHDSHPSRFANPSPWPSKKRPRSSTNRFLDDDNNNNNNAAHDMQAHEMHATMPLAHAKKESDALGGGNFVSLTSCNAALQIASQLSLGRKAGASANLAGHQTGPSAATDKPGAIHVSCEALASASASSSSAMQLQNSTLPDNLDFATWHSESQRFSAELLESFFEFHLPFYPIIHPATFRAQLQGTVCPPQSPAWPMLVNMVFALGAFERRVSADEADFDTLFYSRANRLFNAVLFDKAEIISVQALTLMANYCQKKNHFSSAWMVLGSALRMAISMGLHSEATLQARDMPAFDKEFGRRLWYTLFTMEADTCVSMARPNALLSINADVAPPLNVDETAMSPTSDQLPAQVSQATMSSTLAVHAKFASEISMPLQARLIKGTNPSIEEVRAFDLKTEEFVDHLPDYMDDGYTGPRPASFSVATARLRWRCNNFRMVMFRPFLLSNAVAAAAASSCGAPRPVLRPAVKQAIALCRRMASNNIRSISCFWHSHPHNQAMAWHAIYFLTQSALVPLVSLLDEPTNQEAREWVNLLQTCIRLLVDMGHITPIGAKCKEAIETLAGGLLRESMDDDNCQSMLLSKWMSEAQTDNLAQGSTAEVDPLIWSSHLMAASSHASDEASFHGVVAHPTDPSLTMSLDSASSDGMSVAAFDFASGIDASPTGDHCSSLAGSIDAWATATARPTTASQWSENGSSSLPDRELLNRERIDHWFGLQASHPQSGGRHNEHGTASTMFNTSEPALSQAAATGPATQSHQPATHDLDWHTATADPSNWWNVQYKHSETLPSNSFMFAQRDVHNNNNNNAGTQQGRHEQQHTNAYAAAGHVHHHAHGHPHPHNHAHSQQHLF